VCFSAVRGDWNAHFAGFVTGLVLADTVVWPVCMYVCMYVCMHTCMYVLHKCITYTHIPKLYYLQPKPANLQCIRTHTHIHTYIPKLYYLQPTPAKLQCIRTHTHTYIHT
jgi:hypothetical protein